MWPVRVCRPRFASLVDHFVGLTDRSDGHSDVALLLLDAGANVRLHTTLDESPLHAAAAAGSAECVAALLKRGARVNAVTRSTELSPLHVRLPSLSLILLA
jgi:ankyrin repeat protein